MTSPTPPIPASEPGTGIGTVLVTFGGLCTIDGVHSDDIQHCRGTARLVEVQHSTPDQIVFDLEVSDQDPNAIGWLVYRAYRVGCQPSTPHSPTCVETLNNVLGDALR